MSSHAAAAPSRLSVVPDTRGRNQREDSLRHVRRALRQLEAREDRPKPADRFAYLKRTYD